VACSAAGANPSSVSPTPRAPQQQQDAVLAGEPLGTAVFKQTEPQAASRGQVPPEPGQLVPGGVKGVLLHAGPLRLVLLPLARQLLPRGRHVSIRGLQLLDPVAQRGQDAAVVHRQRRHLWQALGLLKGGAHQPPHVAAASGFGLHREGG
jgi:hypothetical protein